MTGGRAPEVPAPGGPAESGRVISEIPTSPVDVPAAVSVLAGDEPARPVWRNQLGGLTFELGGGARRRFVKWAPAGSGLDLAAEARRLAWVQDRTPVPQVLDAGEDDDGAWLLTRALPGRSAVEWATDPRQAVVAVGEGLRAFHEALPVAGCPFSWAAEERLARAEAHRRAGGTDPARWEPEHRALGVERAFSLAAQIPPVEHLVVCHGDACVPNTLVGDDGRWSGHVDLGALGLADRWADLAAATWSTRWNYGPGWERLLLDAYGVAPDEERTRYYRLLWDLGP
ncbi:aminoglycoside 3'-phosphotransferase [Georgenia faecalis]|uniref:aminoglycoside 3'-phosphotransferase n=1 Tax=Georgenia faecalis TaxID=2483799 RepID=UPI000FDB88C0|nr:aminoglycoside 3'-phosphotransferase [Georgenia faecalis]